MKDDLAFLRLWDLYSPLLTATQREITDLYFNYDLSLAEIAEQKGVSRQSVSDCLSKCRKQLERYEEKLGFAKTLTQLSREYSAYMTTVTRFIKAHNSPDTQALKKELDAVHEEFGAEIIETE
ncbi:MAG: DNA-binding protein [Clostridiales bacterium]|nr:DNA-binding protein [Clostridiales bacterium]